MDNLEQLLDKLEAIADSYCQELPYRACETVRDRIFSGGIDYTALLTLGSEPYYLLLLEEELDKLGILDRDTPRTMKILGKWRQPN